MLFWSLYKSKSIRLISLKILQKTNRKTFGDTCLMDHLKIQKTFCDLFKKTLFKKKSFFFTPFISKRFKSFCGLTSYLRMEPGVGVIEVGWITYASILQKTVEGTEAMYLMMKNVFDDLGYRRYEWKCDNLNSKSKKTALRLGFKYEGLFRQATIYKKRNRDTAWFSIIDKEWKQYKKKYKRYLKRSNFNEKFVQNEKVKIILVFQIIFCSIFIHNT